MSTVNQATVFVGLDYHSASVQVCALSPDGQVLMNRSCTNDWRAVMGAVRKRCPGAVNVQAAIESCCGAAGLADELIGHAQGSVNLAHPGYVARMKQSPDKTDFSDARMLADLQRVGYLPKVWLAPEEVRELRRLVHYRQRLARERRNLKLQIGATLRLLRAAHHAAYCPCTNRRTNTDCRGELVSPQELGFCRVWPDGGIGRRTEDLESESGLFARA